MAFVEPVTLAARRVKLLPLALSHEDGLRAHLNYLLNRSLTVTEHSHG